MSNYGGLQPWDGAPSSAMRASDADRERGIDVLKAAFSEGRLTREEYEERMGRAHQARTYGELGALVADLPQGPVPTGPRPGPYPGPPLGSYPRPAVPASFLPTPRRPTNGLAVVSLLCGIASPVLVPAAVPAIVLGYRARGQIRQSFEAGEGMATAGVVLGWLVAAFWGLLLVVAVASGA